VNRLLLACCLLLGMAAFQSCDDPERTTLTYAERELLDSLYSRKVPYARMKADSICKATYQSIFDRAADSIKLVYIEEIKQIIKGEG